MKKRSMRQLVWTAAAAAGLASPAAGAQYILTLAAGADISQVVAQHALTVVRPLAQSGQNVYLVSGPDPAPDGLVQQLLADASISTAEPDMSLISLEARPSAPTRANTAALANAMQDTGVVPYFGATVRHSYASQPSASLIHLPDALMTFATGGGIVAVIDTGVDANHPALQGVVVPGYDFTRDQPGPASDLADLDQSTVAILDQSTVAILDSGQAAVVLNQSTVAILDQSTVAILDGAALPSDFGHGTMVAGLIHLVAPTAQIMPLKAFKADGSADFADIVRAIYYAVDNGATVINMSFGSDDPSPSLDAAVQYALRNNVICVAAAGNDGVRETEYPAGIAGTLGVGSTDTNDNRSRFTNYGSRGVDMAAPGEGLITTYPGNHYAGVWGTSFSTALASGAAALLTQIAPNITPSQATRSLRHGRNLDEDLGLGDGRLDVYSSILYYLNRYLLPD
jgi:subtilisin family serine protease